MQCRWGMLLGLVRIFLWWSCRNGLWYCTGGCRIWWSWSIFGIKGIGWGRIGLWTGLGLCRWGRFWGWVSILRLWHCSVDRLDMDNISWANTVSPSTCITSLSTTINIRRSQRTRSQIILRSKRKQIHPILSFGNIPIYPIRCFKIIFIQTIG